MNPRPELVGYGAIALGMAGDADLAIYRSFLVLSTRNLLYMQSEIATLESQLQDFDAECNDQSKGIEIWSIPRSWSALQRDNGEHLRTVLLIRERLEKYCYYPLPSYFLGVKLR